MKFSINIPLRSSKGVILDVATTEVAIMLSNKDISNEKYVNEIRLKVCEQRMLGWAAAYFDISLDLENRKGKHC